MRVRRAIPLAAVIAASVLAAAGWYLGSPLFIRTTVNEPVPTLATSRATLAPGATPLTVISAETLTRVIAHGELQYVDAQHNGKGTVVLIRIGVQHFLRFEDVAITNAPDVHVYLSRERGGAWSETTSLYLGPLKATNGSFNYEIPAGTDVAIYRSVVVWCRAFSVLVTWADLQAA
ncbi:MAG: DM13 domain-containing protein [Chloroflexota bacterium]|nr:DM13 domain-containing protein [Chloroflexota bacterium]